MTANILSTSYSYVVMKGSLHAADTSVFGLNDVEIKALQNRYSGSGAQIINGILIKAPPVVIINALGELGYKVVAATGEAEVTWTLQREK